MSVLVVLPSYNESGNIIQLIEAIGGVRSDIKVCVVDDNSPDGTALIVKNYISGLSPIDQLRVKLIVRQKKDGRGGAVRAGFEWGLNEDSNIKVFIEMDCDFSHDPKYLLQGIELLNSADFVIGARYPNGSVVGWPLKRRIFSRLSNLLTRALIDWSIHDYTNGYRFYSREATSFLCQQPQRFKGYIYLSECLAFLIKKRFRGTSFPIVFVNRQIGKSNTTLNEIFTSLISIFQIAWDFRFKK